MKKCRQILDADLMKHAMDLYLSETVCAWFFLLALSPVSSCTATADNAIASGKKAVDDVRISYLSAGHGPTVILLHGFAETSRMWKPIIPLLAETFTVIAPDLPGIGDSAIPANGLGGRALFQQRF